MLQTVAAVCVGVVAAIFIYYVTNTESPQKTSNRNKKENSTYAEIYDLGKGLGEDNCPICQHPLRAEPTLTTVCRHKIHSSCFQLCHENGLKNCPVCRRLL